MRILHHTEITQYFLPVLILVLLCGICSPQAQAERFEVPQRADAGLTKAEFFLAQGKYSQALQTLAYVLQRHPANADAYTYRGLAYLKLNDIPKALKDFKTATKINPRHLGANFYLGEYHAGKGDLDLAFEQLQVIRMVCGRTDCAELNALEHIINNSKAKAAATAPAQKQRWWQIKGKFKGKTEKDWYQQQ